MAKLTIKQQLFCDYYLKCKCATQAAKEAGYSEKTAGAIGAENLTKPLIKEYIDKRIDEIKSKAIADIQEVMEFQTKVMRGEIKDAFNLDPTLKDRLDASKELGGRLEKRSQTADKEVVISNAENILIKIKDVAAKIVEDES